MKTIEGHTATITIEGDVVTKTIHLDKLIDRGKNTKVGNYDIINRECTWLLKLAEWDRSPKILGVSEYQYKKNICSFDMEYVGEPINSLNIPRNYKEQCEEILAGLKQYNCSHNDIRPANITVKEGKLYLIDFQWATEIGEKIPKNWPISIGSKFRKGDHIFDDRYSLYETIKVIHPINIILKNIKKNRPVSFARYGDGEWNAIFGIKGANCDGHEYFPDMGKKLGKIVISNPKYIMGMQNRARRLMGDKIKKFTKEVDINWVNSDLFHHSSLNGDLGIFFEALKEKTIMIVGGSYLRNIKVIKFKYFVDIPGKNCWLKHDEILNEIIRHFNKFNPKNLIVLFCASMMANVLIDELYNLYNGQHSFIDVGSALDPYVGKKTRKYHKTLKI